MQIRSEVTSSTASPDPDRSPIFLIGSGRSGTTLLRQILSAHPRIHLTHEAFFYTYEKSTPRQLTSTQWLERYFRTYSFRWLRVEREAVLSQLPQQLPRARVSEAFRAIMKAAAARHGKPRYGEKSPLNVNQLERIFADFPDARVINIMRDPRATIVSYTRVPWGSDCLAACSWTCRQQYKSLEPYFDRMHELTLEELLASPRSTLAAVLDFIGEPWDDAVLDHVNHAPADDVPPLPWHLSALRRSLSPPSGKPPLWRSVLSPEWIRIIESDNAPTMKRYGYSEAELDREPSAAARWAAIMKDVPAGFATAWRHARVLGASWKFWVRDGHVIEAEDAMNIQLQRNPSAWKYFPDFEIPRVPQQK